jgi:hypothetical protein
VSDQLNLVVDLPDADPEDANGSIEGRAPLVGALLACGYRLEDASWGLFLVPEDGEPRVIAGTLDIL